MAMPVENVVSKTKSKQLLTRLKQLTKNFLNDKKHSNCLIDILSVSETDDSQVAIGCVKAFHKIFTSLLKSDLLFLENPPEDDKTADLTKNEQYTVWLRGRYSEAKQRLLEFMMWHQSPVQEMALSTLMKFVSLEGHNPLQIIDSKHLYFPSSFFKSIVQCFLSCDRDMESLIGRFQEYSEFDDVRYYMLKFCLESINSTQEPSQSYLNNMLTVLLTITMPTVSDSDVLNNFLSKAPDASIALKITAPRGLKRLFSTVWLKLLSHRLTTAMYRKVLVGVHDKLMPHMTNPLLLSDFLTESYNVGGAISLLALNGLFILVNKYNLDYPDFYTKLYALLEPSVFHVKYRARFFYLCDLFLSSTLLPAYLVAAFVKRLARLGLTAPPTGLAVIIPFIYNLLMRHPNCKVLLDRPDSSKDLSDDPYDMTETDPAKCNALQSSLWELKTLQSHYYYSVSANAKRMDEGLPRTEIDISQFLELTSDELFQKECKKRLKEDPAVTFRKPQGLFCANSDAMSELWALSS